MSNDSVLRKRVLGRKLRQVRRDAGVSRQQAAHQIARDIQSVGRFERGETLIDAHQLATLCTRYQVDEPTELALRQMRDAAARPVWWHHLGDRPKAIAALLAMEEHAHRIRQFDHHAIPGLLQTMGYARANIELTDPERSAASLDADVGLRMQRQVQIWHRDHPPRASYLIDEGVLWRMPGAAPGRRAQLERLLDPPAGVRVQVVPFDAGPHPSMGSYAVFDLELGSLAQPAKGVYCEGLGDPEGVTAETEKEIARYERTFERTRVLASTPADSARRIEHVISRIEDD